MKIIRYKGKLWKGDIIFKIKTNGEEAFAMDRLLILINQFTLNEFNGFKRKGYAERKLSFYFENAIQEVIALGKKEIDLLDEKNEEIAKELCKKYYINYTKWKQTSLQEFE